MDEDALYPFGAKAIAYDDEVSFVIIFIDVQWFENWYRLMAVSNH